VTGNVFAQAFARVAGSWLVIPAMCRPLSAPKRAHVQARHIIAILIAACLAITANYGG
jgi:hypothetical protein